MHYGDGFASKNDEKTLVPKNSGVSQKIKNKQISKIILHVKLCFILDLNMLRLILIVTTLITRCEVAAESGGEAGRQISHGATTKQNVWFKYTVKIQRQLLTIGR